MNVSGSFLLGLGVALLAEELFPWLPGEAKPANLAAAALVLPLPWLWAATTSAWLRTVRQRGRHAGPALALALRLQPATVPLAYLVLVGAGGLGELAVRAAPESHTLRFLLMLAPLLALELSLRVTEMRAERGTDAPTPVGPAVVGMTLLVVATVLCFGIALDVIAQDRRLEILLHATSSGSTVGMLALVLGLAAILPLLFRFVLPTSRALPDHVAADVWSAAQSLGFSPRRVLSMRTGHRMVNAALVGPLPWPRYLVLTDGMLAYLDALSLRGVVAHEVGHARAGHPALLLVVFAVVPILLLHPIARLDLDGVAPWVLVAAGGAMALAAFVTVRALMHRFELEADQLSASALGGAGPCITALRRVGDLFPAQRTRPSFRHPSEEQRVRSLLLWDTDAAFRDAFLRRGRAVRRAILLAAAIAAVLSILAHLTTAPVDLAVVRLYSGDFAGAARALSASDESPARTAELRGEIEAARALLPAGGEWSEIRDELATRAWERAIVLATDVGPSAARPYFVLATVGSGSGDPVRETAWLWSDAVARADWSRAERLAEHLATLPGTPPPLAEVALAPR